MPNITKVTADGWLEAARIALIEEGLAGVKVDRLAKRLGVTRGGFYHNFKNQRELLEGLIQHWRKNNSFVPNFESLRSHEEALEILDKLVGRIILEDGFSPEFDLAIREWGRIDEKASKAVEAVDAERIEKLTRVFIALGCDEKEAAVRASVFYFHQIGYYALGYQHRETGQDRLALAPTYMRILCGRRYLEAVEAGARKWL